MSTEDNFTSNDSVDWKVIVSLLFCGFTVGLLFSLLVFIFLPRKVEMKGNVAEDRTAQSKRIGEASGFVRQAFEGKEDVGIDIHQFFSYKILHADELPLYKIVVTGMESELKHIPPRDISATIYLTRDYVGQWIVLQPAKQYEDDILKSKRVADAEAFIRKGFKGEESIGIDTDSILSYKITSSEEKDKFVVITVDAKIQAVGTPTEEIKFKLAYDTEFNVWEVVKVNSHRKALEQ